ncbi:MAG: IMP dehydrogenase [Candidatus Moranbacteria bacterium]|nr:IMP dehydrogenase [Candidatus Moranbacteria bacterium]
MIYAALYPNLDENAAVNITPGYTLYEASYREFYTETDPKAASLETRIGPVTMNTPVLAAAMDTVSGTPMAQAMSKIGGAAVIFRHRLAKTQLAWAKEAVNTKPFLKAKPICLRMNDRIRKVEETYKRTHHSTYPVLEGKKLVGMIFARDISWEGKEEHSVAKWMKPLKHLKTVSPETPFETIRHRLLNEKNCRVLPVMDKNGIFHGMYFVKDVRHANPAWHNGKPLVGMAIGVHNRDILRVKRGLQLGVAIYVIDSSHGNCSPVIKQAKRVVKLVADRGAVIAGNVASVDSYVRLAETGVHAVKAGIGSGSICTTSQVTGVGVPMWTLIRELRFAQKYLKAKGLHAPDIIADGGISGPGFAVRALLAGAHTVMAGEWLAAANESGSPEIKNLRREINGFMENRYRGMASVGAINDRSSDRYGITKSAPEGVDGWVRNRGPLLDWWDKDDELMRGGFGHLGVKNITELHKRGDDPYTWLRFSGAGQQQMAVRVTTS